MKWHCLILSGTAFALPVGWLVQAVELYRQAVKLDMQLLGEDHPDTESHAANLRRVRGARAKDDWDLTAELLE